MAIGLSGIAPQTAASTQGIPEQGIQQNTIPLQGINDTVQQAPGANLPDTWFKHDLENPYILPWGEFNIDPNFNFRSALGSYHVEPPARSFMIPQNWMGSTGMGFGGTGKGPGWQGGAQDLFYSPIKNQIGRNKFETTYGLPNIPSQNIMGHWMMPQQRRGQPTLDQQLSSAYGANTGFINFKDPVLSKAIETLNKKAYSALAPKIEQPRNQYSIFGQTFDLNPRKKAAEPKIALNNSTGWSPLARLADAKLRDAIFAETAAELGMKPEDLQFHYGKYDKAYRSLRDPVGANWQDLKQSPVYDRLLGDIRSYAQENSRGGNKNRSTGFDAGYFDRINAMAGDFRQNPNYLPAEYFVLHQPNVKYPGRAGDSGTGAVKGKGFSAIANHDPYRLQDWTDYADQNKAWWQLTPEEKALAKQGMAKHSALLSAPYDQGGPFDLIKTNNLQLPAVKRAKEYWQYSPRMGELNVAQNMLGWNTQGKKNFQDAGIDPNAAFRDSVYIKKKKKKKGGLGGILGTALSLASFIPGPVGVAARIGSALNSFANNNPIGGLMGLAGASGLTGNLTDKIGSSLVGAGLSEGAAKAVIGGGLGALGSAAGGGNPVLGAALGAGGAGLSNYLNDSMGWSPEVSRAVTGLGSGAVQTAYGYNRAKDRARKMMQAQRRA